MKKTNRILSVLLSAALLLGLVPAVSAPVSASGSDAGQFIPVYLNGYTIMNGGITSGMPTKNYRDVEGKMDDTSVNLTALNPEGKVSHASNAGQMSEDLASYNMIRCFGTKNCGDTEVSGTVLWAFENGITFGNSDTTFGPNDLVTRGQAVTFLFRALNAAAGEENPFTDVRKEAFYYNAVLWAYENGVTRGNGDTTFGPLDACLRAHIVTFLYRAYGGA